MPRRHTIVGSKNWNRNPPGKLQRIRTNPRTQNLQTKQNAGDNRMITWLDAWILSIALLCPTQLICFMLWSEIKKGAWKEWNIAKIAEEKYPKANTASNTL